MTAECGEIYPYELDYCLLAEHLVEHECKIADILAIIDDVYVFMKEK